MILLGVDTCDSRGSIAVLRDLQVLSVDCPSQNEEYSSWLIPACTRALSSCALTLSAADGYAVASGPGSFTGLRVGLTTIKAWSEVFLKPVAAVSRLEAIAFQVSGPEPYVAACVDALRGQLFGALYRIDAHGLHRVQDEMVLPPAEFVDWVIEQAGSNNVAWASLDLELLNPLQLWRQRIAGRDSVHPVSPPLAPVIARMGMARLQAAQGTDALRLDAEYVRRSDAELFWKDAVKPALRA